MGFNLRTTQKTLIPLTILALSAWLLPAIAEPGAYYRYLNAEGVKVLDKRIPPEYAQNGYEILNKNAQVIEVVPPAPTGDEIVQHQSQREIMVHFDRLRKRYSDVASIESARKRRLDNLDTSISILNGNISTLSQQLENEMNMAATREREGKAVPAAIQDKITSTKAELAVAQELLNIRIKEKENINSKFDKDIEYFVQGKALAKNNPSLLATPNETLLK